MSQSYRLKLSRPSLKLKVATRIPAQLVAGTGVSISKANGVYTFDIDEAEVENIAEAAANAAVAAGVGVDIQAYDADLAALAANSTDGLWAHTGAGTGSARTITGTAAEITVTNGNGVSGNPTLSLPAALTFTGKTITGGTFASPALTTPALGTPASGNLANCTGVVSSIAGNTGAFTLGNGLTNSTNSLVVSLTRASNVLGADVNLNNTSNYFDGPSMAQGSTGTWFAIGTITLSDSSVTSSNIHVKLWDGTNVIASTSITTEDANASARVSVTLSGYITSPAGNIRMSARDITATTGRILFNQSGNSGDSTVFGFRIA